MRRLIVVLTLATAATTTACGGGQQTGGAGQATTTTPSSTAAAPDRAKVAFADDICGAVAKFITPAAAFRPDTSSPAAAMNSLKTQLSSMSTGLADAGNDLKDADTAGVPDGQAAVDKLRTTFSQMKQAVDNAKTKLDAVDPNNQQAVTTAVQDATKEMASSLGSMQNPMDSPAMSGPEMEAAAEQSEECKKIKQVVSNRQTGSSTPTS
ncbi:hypothetical protein [Kibdelosporangium phytohabitans]|uniref:Small secreted protein n=1 Tax=Kibdelosporangium phytohabitans TaxID=860235 RepID=A0A0N9I709_9PSEU|nr:hypothetical protein [Kibdelosporangium phytohabitans]ALG10276.1 hypothetical protein AOZ06_28300 [Kibdelosporangium phytohabitans]MBE1461306.1 ABC-type glycerol-3-phosphate transport system substrate-binding protein [Kibdelosporangium phytohabitans]